MASLLNSLSPTAPRERNLSLDILRGFALLGILIMNIQNFSMIEAAYLNPAAYGDLTGLNKWVWILSHIFGDQKFMTIFSVMFGAGIIMMTGRATASGRNAAGLHYRRTAWLLVIGLIHAYLLWRGDILVSYALCALLVFLFRNRSPRTLLLLGLLTISVSSLLYLFFGWSVRFWTPATVKQTMESWKPATEAIRREIAAYRGNWAQQMTHRVPASLGFQTFIFLIWTGWRAGGLMLIGMALYKWKVLTGERSKQFYRRLAAAGFVVGLPVVSYGIIKNFDAGWSLDYSMFLGSQYNYWGSLFVSMGYIGMVILFSKANFFGNLRSAFAAVGRTALSNYLLQTLLCTTIFYGHGLGLFGKVDRAGQVLIVIAIWGFQLMISPLWLRHFQYGPAEWLWRSLTYKKIQPLRHRIQMA